MKKNYYIHFKTYGSLAFLSLTHVEDNVKCTGNEHSEKFRECDTTVLAHFFIHLDH